VAFRPPQNAIRGGWAPPSATPIGWAATALPFSFFKKKKKINFKKISFIYLFFSIFIYFFFIRMDTCCHLISTDVTLSWHLIEFVKKINEI
jgi:hypothetical protein